MGTNKIRITVSDFEKRQLEIDFDFDWSLVEDVKQITGRQYNDSNEVWRVSLNERNLIEFLSFCQKNDITISDNEVKKVVEKVKEDAQKKHDKYEENKELATKKEPDLEKVYGLRRGMSLYPFQRVAVEYIEKNKNVLIGDEMGLGKAQPLSSPVLTPDGWREMNEIEEGNYVINSSGKKTKVTGTYPKGKKDILKITFSDGATVRATEEHLWSVRLRSEKFRGKGFNKTKTTKELQNSDLRDGAGNKKWFIPMTNPVKFNVKKEPEIDPYLLGLLLGDGTLHEEYISFSTTDQQLLKEVKNRIPEKAYTAQSGDHDYRIGFSQWDEKNLLHNKIRELNLIKKSHEKFIPDHYKFGTIETRYKVIQGLLDTDGSTVGSGVTFSSASKKLCSDVQEIVRSLGGTATRHSRVPEYTYNDEKRKGKKSYRLYIRFPNEFEPFNLKRKSLKNPQERDPTRSIEKIEYVGKEKAKCISVEAENNLYITKNYVVTHNTVEALGAMEHLESYPALIVCPASLKENWKNEAENWLPKKRSINVINASDDDPTFRRRVVIINYALLRKYKDTLLDKDWKMIVADESHYLKNEDAKRTQNFKDISNEVPYKLLLSGTPITNRPSELISQLKILDVFEDEFGGWWEYVNKFCSAEKTQWGMDISGASNLKELHEKLLSTCYIRRNKEDVLEQLPEKSRQVVKFNILNREEYNKVEHNIVQYFKDKALKDDEFQEKIEGLPEFQQEKLKKERASKAMSKAIGAQHLVKLSELRKVTAKGKLKPITDWIDNFLKSEQKLVLFAHHTAVCDAIEKKYNCLKITGEVPSEDRQDIVDKFQNDPDEQLIILNIAAGGVGITLTAASHVGFIELAWSPAAIDQAEARCHRISQENAVNIYYLLAENTIDEKVHRLIEKKRQVTNKVNAGKDLTEEDLKELEKESDVTKQLVKELLQEDNN